MDRSGEQLTAPPHPSPKKKHKKTNHQDKMHSIACGMYNQWESVMMICRIGPCLFKSHETHGHARPIYIVLAPGLLTPT